MSKGVWTRIRKSEVGVSGPVLWKFVFLWPVTVEARVPMTTLALGVGECSRLSLSFFVSVTWPSGLLSTCQRLAQPASFDVPWGRPQCPCGSESMDTVGERGYSGALYQDSHCDLLGAVSFLSGPRE